MPADGDDLRGRQRRRRPIQSRERGATVESGREGARYEHTGFNAKGRLITLVYGWSGGVRRAITAWKATSDEERQYHEDDGS